MTISCIQLVSFIGIVQQQPQPAAGSKILFVTYLVYLILGFILGFLIRHLFGKLNFSRKLRDKQLTEEIEILRKRAYDLEEENKRLRKA